MPIGFQPEPENHFCQVVKNQILQNLTNYPKLIILIPPRHSEASPRHSERSFIYPRRISLTSRHSEALAEESRKLFKEILRSLRSLRMTKKPSG